VSGGLARPAKCPSSLANCPEYRLRACPRQGGKCAKRDESGLFSRSKLTNLAATGRECRDPHR
jgi:hypothetical protein